MTFVSVAMLLLALSFFVSASRKMDRAEKMFERAEEMYDRVTEMLDARPDA